MAHKNIFLTKSIRLESRRETPIDGFNDAAQSEAAETLPHREKFHKGILKFLSMGKKLKLVMQKLRQSLAMRGNPIHMNLASRHT